MKEIWKSIKEFDGFYEISNRGRLKSFKRNKETFLIPHKRKDGYLMFYLYHNKKQYYRYAHRLVAQCFIEKIEGKETVNHKDGNKQNNISDNLEWLTMGENNYHAGLINLKQIGSNHSNSKLSFSDLKEIRELLKQDCLTNKQIGEQYKVHRSTIYKICKGISYRKQNT